MGLVQTLVHTQPNWWEEPAPSWVDWDVNVLSGRRCPNRIRRPTGRWRIARVSGLAARVTASRSEPASRSSRFFWASSVALVANGALMWYQRPSTGPAAL